MAGRPISVPRSDYATRKANREAFQALKQELANSPAAVAQRAKWAVVSGRSRVREKVRSAIKEGTATPPFTAEQAKHLTPTPPASQCWPACISLIGCACSRRKSRVRANCGRPSIGRPPGWRDCSIN